MRDIRLIRDQRSGKSKGVGYVEFGDPESVMKALALNGIAFKGQPLLVQARREQWVVGGASQVAES